MKLTNFNYMPIKNDFELRAEAGLVEGGYDEANEPCWLGDDKAWERYNGLVLKEAKNPIPEKLKYYTDLLYGLSPTNKIFN